MGQENLAVRKARGAYFTPPEITSFLCEWAIRVPTDRILEPSCGEAAFLTSAIDRLGDLGCAVNDADQIHGMDIHEASVSAAADILARRDAGATLSCGNFFARSPSQRFDAVIGNPPYVRYQDFSGTSRLQAKEAAFAQGVKLTGLASSWAAFVVHASAFLKDSGRLALVLPAELLTVSYAGPIRSFLMRRFEKVRLIVFQERVFPDVLEEVVLLLAEGRGPTDHCELHQATNLKALTELDKHRWSPTSTEGKWTAAFLSREAAGVYERLSSGRAFTTLKSWGETTLGSVTGNNRFFTLTETKATARGLASRELLKISPPGSRHLRSLAFTAKSWREMRDEGAPVYLFDPPEQAFSEAAQHYIDDGESAEVHEAYKCKVRSPWWKVPSGQVPDLFLTYMNHDTPRLVTNRARVRYLNSIHGVFLEQGHRRLGMDLLPIAALNSATLLGAELVGRAYGGGMLKIEPGEADTLPVPSRDVVEATQRPLRGLRGRLTRFLDRGDLESAVAEVDEIVLQRHLQLAGKEIQFLRTARQKLFQRRQARGNTRR